MASHRHASVRPSRSSTLAVVMLAICAACAPPSRNAPVEPQPLVLATANPQLPALAVRQTDPPPTASEPQLHPLLERLAPGPPVTLSAANVDVRTLLAALTEDLGISLVFDERVQGRVGVNLVDVPAVLAIQRVMEAAGVTFATELESPWAPTVFYALPVNVNEASAELISARFGVSGVLAEWVVKERVR